VFDLDLKWEQRILKIEKLKNGKPTHGVMICDVITREIIKHGIPIF
jgi:hypothetical protein